MSSPDCPRCAVDGAADKVQHLDTCVAYGRGDPLVLALLRARNAINNELTLAGFEISALDALTAGDWECRFCKQRGLSNCVLLCSKCETDFLAKELTEDPRIAAVKVTLDQLDRDDSIVDLIRAVRKALGTP